jgi:hypothetical protein
MTPYEIKLQERADAMAKVKFWSEDDDRILDNAEIDERVKEMMPLAKLSLEWCAEYFERGIVAAIGNRFIPERPQIDKMIIENGLKPQTETL